MVLLVHSLVETLSIMIKGNKNQVMINNVPYHPNEIFHIHSGTWDPSGEWVNTFH